MLTVGIDLASQPKNTALCAIAWTRHEARVQECRLNVTNADIEAAAEDADKIGIDVPFGWPQAFTTAITAHNQRHLWPSATSLELRYRRTDLYVQSATFKWPLSVSSDRIACTAFRAAALLSRIEQRSGPIDRIGSGTFVEVYPRAARDRWEITSPDELFGLTRDWLTVPDPTAIECRRSKDCFDALIAALVTRAAAIKLCDSVPESDLESASHEGWIALPHKESLTQLLSEERPASRG
jgi:predicted nuclease with RNAse H fold